MTTLRRLARHRGGLVGAAIVLLFLTLGLSAAWVSPHDPLQGDMTRVRLPPSLAYPFGTDQLGRDVASRILHGTAISLRSGVAAVAIGIVIGVPIGLSSGYFGGIVDLLAQRLVDGMMAFPNILLAILVVSVIGSGLETTVLAIGLVSVPIYSRLVRASVLGQMRMEYVLAARSIGSSDLRIVVRHVLPNSVSPVIVQSTLHLASAILAVAGLSFIGLGAQPPTPEWGAMLAQGQQFIRTSPHLVLFPGLVISLTVLGLNLFGDALRDALDPREWTALDG